MNYKKLAAILGVVVLTAALSFHYLLNDAPTISGKAKSSLDLLISDQAQSSLELLRDWEASPRNYNLYYYKDMQFHASMQNTDLVEEWFPLGIRKKGYDFLEFAYTRAGDPFTLWFYPELKGEPPVVLLDGDGDVQLLAPSLEDFICLLADQDSISGTWQSNKVLWYQIYKFEFIQVAEKNSRYVNADQARSMVDQDIEKLKSKIAKFHKCRDVPIILKDFDRHPDFKEWFLEYFKL